MPSCLLSQLPPSRSHCVVTVERPRRKFQSNLPAPCSSASRSTTRSSLARLGGALRAAGQQRLGVDEHDRIVVHVDDPRIRRDRLGDLVGVVRPRRPGTAWPGPGTPVRPDPFAQPGRDREHPLSRLAVGGEVVLLNLNPVFAGSRAAAIRISSKSQDHPLGAGFYSITIS
jgi:hypothetical protein